MQAQDQIRKMFITSIYNANISLKFIPTKFIARPLTNTDMFDYAHKYDTNSYIKQYLHFWGYTYNEV